MDGPCWTRDAVTGFKCSMTECVSSPPQIKPHWLLLCPCWKVWPAWIRTPGPASPRRPSPIHVIPLPQFPFPCFPRPHFPHPVAPHHSPPSGLHDRPRGRRLPVPVPRPAPCLPYTVLIDTHGASHIPASSTAVQESVKLVNHRWPCRGEPAKPPMMTQVSASRRWSPQPPSRPSPRPIRPSEHPAWTPPSHQLL